MAAEEAVQEVPGEEREKVALTGLFEAFKTDKTPIFVDNIVNQFSAALLRKANAACLVEAVMALPEPGL